MLADLSQLLYFWDLKEKRVREFNVIVQSEAEENHIESQKAGAIFMVEQTSQLFYQNYLPISVSFDVKSVL